MFNFTDKPKLPEKCRNCEKPKGYHRSSDKACPLGKKDRTGGYSFHERGQVFTPKIIKLKTL